MIFFLLKLIFFNACAIVCGFYIAFINYKKINARKSGKTRELKL